MNPFDRLAAAARAAGLPCLVIGGHAVILHGLARTTFDLDLAIPRETADAWKNLLATRGHTVLREAPTFLQFNPPPEGGLPTDLMLLNKETFAKLAAAAVEGPPELARLPVVSLAHLLALKCHALKHGHPGRLLKDADDVIRLVELNRVDVNQPEWRELFQKYGPPDLHPKLVELDRARRAGA